MARLTDYQVYVRHTVQSLHHDYKPAKRFGLANGWIDRQRLSGRIPQ